jgi:hypothetical protein
MKRSPDLLVGYQIQVAAKSCGFASAIDSDTAEIEIIELCRFLLPFESHRLATC